MTPQVGKSFADGKVVQLICFDGCEVVASCRDRETAVAIAVMANLVDEKSSILTAYLFGEGEESWLLTDEETQEIAGKGDGPVEDWEQGQSRDWSRFRKSSPWGIDALYQQLLLVLVRKGLPLPTIERSSVMLD